MVLRKKPQPLIVNDIRALLIEGQLLQHFPPCSASSSQNATRASWIEGLSFSGISFLDSVVGVGFLRFR